MLLTTKNKLTNTGLKHVKMAFDADLSNILRKEDTLETIKGENKIQYILRNGVPLFIQMDDLYIPTVKCVHMIPEILKKAVVDTGAIKHLLNGADVMAPGLLHSTSELPEVFEGEPIAIYAYGKEHALAVGVMQMANEEILEKRTGIAIKMINYLGDKIYEFTA
ncbi:malignant T-cell-amplified sequence [Nematocida sp. LUAm3]|nr:malignant T-cell-amplified sequence [Nematocida sp. LUAm3]KAI5173744.1 malignant T-cell-amplified sequence [Nematocida sp. LUAm2]KAI5176967.1 malignant T-cell-amplified sequence [Nematocida sp. LUAm1]